MIQVSTLPLLSPESPAKTAGSAAPEGLFASLLDMGQVGGLGETALPTGKSLPVAGKELPVALPVLPEMAELPVAPVLSTLRDMPVATELSARPELLTDPAAPAVPATPVEAAAPIEPVRVESVIAELVEPVSVEPIAIAVRSDADELEAVEPETAETALVETALVETEVQALVIAAAQPFERKIARIEAKAVSAEPALAEARPREAQAPAPVVAQAQAVAQASPAIPAAAAPVAQREAVTLTVPLPSGVAPAKTADAVAEPVIQAPQPARVQQAVEFKLDLASDRQPASGGDLPAARPVTTAALPAFEAPALAAISTEAAATVTGKPAIDTSAAIRPQDLTALVDRLVEARENARSTSASVTVMHAEFGEVSLRFGQDNGNLTVSMANNDPGFVRAVNAATAADTQGDNDMQFQGERRDGGQTASTRTGTDSQASSNDRGTGNGREREARDGRGDRHEPNQQASGRAARRALGGIFA